MVSVHGFLAEPDLALSKLNFCSDEVGGGSKKQVGTFFAPQSDTTETLKQTQCVRLVCLVDLLVSVAATALPEACTPGIGHDRCVMHTR